MTGYENRMFNYCRKLNDAVKRPHPNYITKEMYGVGDKNDISLEALIKWVRENPEEAIKKNFHNYSRFLQ